MNRHTKRTVISLTAALMPLFAMASSHREAPFIHQSAKVDGTDFYLFNSYETAARVT